MTERLTRSQTLLNQRLLAEHCLEEDKIRRLWDSISSKNDDDNENDDENNKLTFEETLAVCNEQLTQIGLEIVSVSIVAGSSSGKYFCIINKFPDDIAQKTFERLFHPQQHAFVRVVLEKLVNDGPTRRNPLLNARLEDKANDGDNDDDAKDKSDENNENNQVEKPKKETSKQLPLPLAEQVLDILTDEKWIDKVKTDEGAIVYALAPRAYAELSYLLEKEFGMDKDDLPQQIYYR